MEKFIKYYSYNQLIEEHDVLVMSQQEYLANQDQLDNPQQIVLVRRQGKPREPKMPQWFKVWSENVYEKRPPQWFREWHEHEFMPFVTRVNETLERHEKLFREHGWIK